MGIYAIAIVALFLAGVACQGEAEQERTALSELAKRAKRPASGVANRIEEVGRGASRTETEAPAGGALYTGRPGTSADPGGEEVPGGSESNRGALTVVGLDSDTDEREIGEIPLEQWREARRERRKGKGAGRGADAGVQAQLQRKDGGVGYTCLKYRKVVRSLGFAFNHLVRFENRCSHAVVCSVTTNRNPQPVIEKVAPGETRTALTFQGSSTRDFDYKVDCSGAKPAPPQWIGQPERDERLQ